MACSAGGAAGHPCAVLRKRRKNRQSSTIYRPGIRWIPKSEMSNHRYPADTETMRRNAGIRWIPRYSLTRDPVSGFCFYQVWKDFLSDTRRQKLSLVSAGYRLACSNDRMEFGLKMLLDFPACPCGQAVSFCLFSPVRFPVSTGYRNAFP